MFERLLKKIITTYYKLEELPQHLLKYLAVSLLCFFGWQSLLIFAFEPDVVLAIHEATHKFLEFSFFMSIGTVSFFAKRWWDNKKQIEKLMEDDPFTKIEDLANMLNERDEALKASEARLRAIFETAPVGIGVIDENRVFKEVNKRFCNILEFENCDDVLGKCVRIIYPSEEEFVRVGREKYAQIEQHGVGTVETVFKKQNGNLIDAILTSTYLDDKKENGTIFSILDVSELKEVTRNLELDEQRLQALFDLTQQKFSSEEEIISYALEECVRITKSVVGYFHFAYDTTDEINLGLFTWSKETMKGCKAEKIHHYPLANAGIWADCVRFGRPVIHNDYPNYPAKKGVPEGHFPIKRHMSVPIYDEDAKLVAVVGVGNKEEEYKDKDAIQLQLFVSSIWRIIDKMRTGFIFEELFNNTINGIAIYESPDDGESFVFKKINPAAAKIGKMSIEEHIGKEIRELYPGIEEAGIFAGIKSTYETGESNIIPLVQYEDNRLSLWVENYIFKLPSGDIVAVYSDVTKRKDAERLLAASEAKFRKALQFNIDAIVLVDKEGKIQYANGAMEKLTGTFEKDLIGKQFGFPTTVGEITSVDIIGKDGKTRCAEMRVADVEIEGELFKVVALRDFTEVEEHPCEEDTSCPVKDYRDEDSNNRR